MKPAAAAPWRRLLPLAALVLAAHLLLLEPGRERLAPPATQTAFVTRSIAAAAPTALTAPAAPATPAIPGTPAPAAQPRRARPPPAPAAAQPVQQQQQQGDVAAAPEASPQATPPAPPAAPTRLVSIPAPARLHYEVTVLARGITLQGQARLDWRHDGSSYEARLELSAPGLRQRVQRSEGRITGAGLAPRYFSDRSRGEQATHFDADQGRIVFSNNQPRAPLVPGMQDRLSVVMQLAALVRGEPARFAAGTQVTLPTAGTRDAEDWIFSVEGEEDVALPNGTMPALKLQRLPRREFDQKLELWLAPRMDYAPVRLRLTNPDGGWVDQRWSSTDRG